MSEIKYGALLLLTNICLLFCICRLEKVIIWTEACVLQLYEIITKEDVQAEYTIEELMRIENENAELCCKMKEEGIMTVASGQRVIEYFCLNEGFSLSNDDYMTLLRIVEAEAGGEDLEGKLLVANVVLNRVLSDSFPDNVVDVVYQKSKGVTQFQPVSSGSINTVKISEQTIEAVEMALSGEDESEGALYFAARKSADPERMKWFDEHLVFLFQHGGHEFFK